MTKELIVIIFLILLAASAIFKIFRGNRLKTLSYCGLLAGEIILLISVIFLKGAGDLYVLLFLFLIAFDIYEIFGYRQKLRKGNKKIF